MVTPLIAHHFAGRIDARRRRAGAPARSRHWGRSTRNSTCCVRALFGHARARPARAAPSRRDARAGGYSPRRRRNLCGSTPKMRYWPSSHEHRSVRDIPFPRAHLAGGQRQAAALLALHEPRVRGFKLGRALGDAALEFRRSTARARASCGTARRRLAPWRAALRERPAPARNPPRPSHSRAAGRRRSAGSRK